MSQTTTATNTYSVADIEAVMRRVTADLVMIASSTGAITEAKAREWAHDIELLAKNGHLRVADITLLSNGVEQRATRYTVDSETGSLSMSRPGGVLWPKVPNAYLRIVLSYNKSYDKDAKEKLRDKLKESWVNSDADTSHSTLKANADRSYSSNAYGMQRQDYI
ncbi:MULTISPECIES: hypothetical protein [Stenotrophomonas]|uniref:HORMA-1 domain-containing protein n=1 Tax=Stenotrophomonas TaxID=40323 RepID=UPI00066B5451|nr:MULTISPECIES: hypothetical protein [Stenotrophomonas]MDH2178606.1 hypothetical protein [Stenotrophomonas sp. GD03654]HDS1082809.1 hypothetical protein [Stenotrophomonas maltophilia]